MIKAEIAHWKSYYIAFNNVGNMKYELHVPPPFPSPKKKNQLFILEQSPDSYKKGILRYTSLSNLLCTATLKGKA